MAGGHSEISPLPARPRESHKGSISPNSTRYRGQLVKDSSGHPKKAHAHTAPLERSNCDLSSRIRRPTSAELMSSQPRSRSAIWRSHAVRTATLQNTSANTERTLRGNRRTWGEAKALKQAHELSYRTNASRLQAVIGHELWTSRQNRPAAICGAPQN